MLKKSVVIRHFSLMILAQNVEWLLVFIQFETFLVLKKVENP
jgi:hypothetical protein